MKSFKIYMGGNKKAQKGGKIWEINGASVVIIAQEM